MFPPDSPISRFGRKKSPSPERADEMLWDQPEIEEVEVEEEEEYDRGGGFSSDFDFLSLLSNTKDFYKILEVDYNATEEKIRSNYIHLALKWHPDKRKGEDSATSKFQEINEAYKVLGDPVKRQQYDKKGALCGQHFVSFDDLNSYRGLILTCNGLGARHWIF